MMPDPSDPQFQLVRLEQDTTQAPVNCNQEYNLFVTKAIYSAAPDPHYHTPPRPLGTSSNPAVYFFQQIEEAFHLPTCPEPLGLATTLVGIQLQSLHGLVFNYQIITYDSRGVQFDGGFWSYTSAGGSPIYGVNDTLWHLPTRVIDRSIVKVQIGERLRELIAQNPFGLSTDPNQWYLSRLYSGSSTNGNAKIQSLQGQFLVGG
jgi:hypothetical protein